MEMLISGRLNLAGMQITYGGLISSLQHLVNGPISSRQHLLGVPNFGGQGFVLMLVSNQQHLMETLFSTGQYLILMQVLLIQVSFR